MNLHHFVLPAISLAAASPCIHFQGCPEARHQSQKSSKAVTKLCPKFLFQDNLKVIETNQTPQHSSQYPISLTAEDPLSQSPDSVRLRYKYFCLSSTWQHFNKSFWIMLASSKCNALLVEVAKPRTSVMQIIGHLSVPL